MALLAAMAWGQYETATVLGTITDPAGLGVTGGKVRLENVQTGVSVSGTTDAAGNYQFLNVRAGTYKVSAEAAGFKLAGESKVLRNPADDHKSKVFDASVRGKTDQFILKFRKPMH